MSADDLWNRSAVEMAGLVRQNAVTREDLVVACLARVQALNPALNAITPTALLSQDAPRPGQPLDGVPVVVNENTDQAGAATTLGIPALKGNIAAQDAPLVASLRAAGARFVGRGHVPDFSLRFHPGSSLHGQVVNPRDPAITAGGSSGGSAVAVAAGMVPVAHGNDLGGSVPYPAYCCGVLGLKVSAGRVPSYNRSMPERPLLLDAMSQQGIFARSVDDIALMAGVLIGASPDDPWSTATRFGGVADANGQPVAVLEPAAGADWSPAVVAALNTAARALADAGLEVRRVPGPDLSDVVATWGAALFAEARVLQAATVRAHGGDAVRQVMEGYLALFPDTGVEGLIAAIQRRTTIARRWTQFFAAIPVVVMPVLAIDPPPPDSDLAGTDAVARLLDAARYCIAGNLVGFPGLSFLVAVGDRLNGVQIVAARGGEERLLAVAARLETVLGGVPVAMA